MRGSGVLLKFWLSIFQRELHFLEVKGTGHFTEPRFKSGSIVLPSSSILNQCTSNITMGAPCRREKPFHGKLLLTPTRQSLFTVFHSSVKAGANLLNGPLTKRGDWDDCFLIWHNEERKGLYSLNIFYTDWLNVGLGKTRNQEVRGQRAGAGTEKEDQRDVCFSWIRLRVYWDLLTWVLWSLSMKKNPVFKCLYCCHLPKILLDNKTSNIESYCIFIQEPHHLLQCTIWKW